MAPSTDADRLLTIRSADAGWLGADTIPVSFAVHHGSIVDRIPFVPVLEDFQRPHPIPVRDPLEQPEKAIRRVYAYVAYRIGAGSRAEDLTSATLERAIRHRSSYRKDDGSPAVWLMRIARRCVDDAEMSPREGESSGEIEVEAREHAEEAAAPPDLPRAMASLDARARDLLALRYGAELGSKEIGRIYEMSAGAVEIALRRALNDLRPAQEQSKC